MRTGGNLALNIYAINRFVRMEKRVRMLEMRKAPGNTGRA